DYYCQSFDGGNYLLF
nr:immunoglobulin light chain junction region [Macaca mulatta]MOW03627.1 immunoglobulin light chain junction region [Macaca mulatta]MOW04003.1 immunoglobulin light chain junction region [Macaca mulatta]MOW04060.1 immunoglobulin light chain junction region [Macaca mulatta]MOW04104.1 immunoglobulin light chain junction region [Macaca mulatta]